MWGGELCLEGVLTAEKDSLLGVVLSEESGITGGLEPEVPAAFSLSSRGLWFC